jgi:hypothetical protein
MMVMVMVMAMVMLLLLLMMMMMMMMMTVVVVVVVVVMITTVVVIHDVSGGTSGLWRMCSDRSRKRCRCGHIVHYVVLMPSHRQPNHHPLHCLRPTAAPGRSMPHALTRCMLIGVMLRLTVIPSPADRRHAPPRCCRSSHLCCAVLWVPNAVMQPPPHLPQRTGFPLLLRVLGTLWSQLQRCAAAAAAAAACVP